MPSGKWVTEKLHLEKGVGKTETLRMTRSTGACSEKRGGGGGGGGKARH